MTPLQRNNLKKKLRATPPNIVIDLFIELVDMAQKEGEVEVSRVMKNRNT